MITSIRQNSEKGVFVIEESIGVDYTEFIHVACPEQEFPTHIYTKWRDPSGKREQGIHLLYGKYERFNIHLFGLPQSLIRNFTVNDLEVPYEVRGFVLIIKVRGNEPYEELRNMPDDPLFSGLAWIRKHGLPFVIVILNKNRRALQPSQVQNILSLNTQVSSIAILSSLDATSIGSVLSTLA